MGEVMKRDGGLVEAMGGCRPPTPAPAGWVRLGRGTWAEHVEAGSELPPAAGGEEAHPHTSVGSGPSQIERFGTQLSSQVRNPDLTFANFM
jgi:hypothetical protein